jgi:integrase
MSTSLLYHAFTVRDVEYRATQYVGDRIVTTAECTRLPAGPQKAGNLVKIELRPHDLRRHAATYASKEDTPIEIVSKAILRHADLSTTQRYLGKMNDMEAIRWIETLHG